MAAQRAQREAEEARYEADMAMSRRCGRRSRRDRYSCNHYACCGERCRVGSSGKMMGALGGFLVADMMFGHSGGDTIVVDNTTTTQ